MRTTHKFYWSTGKTFCGKGKATKPPAMNYWGEVNCKKCLALKGSLVEVSDTNDQKMSTPKKPLKCHCCHNARANRRYFNEFEAKLNGHKIEYSCRFCWKNCGSLECKKKGAKEE